MTQLTRPSRRFEITRAGRYWQIARHPGLGLRIERRTVTVSAAVVAVALVVAVLTMTIGDYPMSFWAVVQALVGAGDDELGRHFVVDGRLPRAVAALAVGAALGVSGALLQELSGNPLGSPDIIGFTIGAASGALVQIVLFDAGPAAVATGAVVGGLATALVIYLLAYRHGVAGYRLVLVGVGVAAVLQSVNTLLVVRADLQVAQTAAQWLAGSLNAMTWDRLLPIVLTLVVLVPVALARGRALATMTLGDELAVGVGVRVERTRTLLIGVAVLLVAAATATAGPVAFVALAAPQIGRRLTRTAGAGLGVAALVGGMLVLVSDLVALRLFAPTQIPVGLVTGTLGGAYLIWLLASQWRTRP